jgi:hypothetical protein
MWLVTSVGQKPFEIETRSHNLTTNIVEIAYCRHTCTELLEQISSRLVPRGDSAACELSMLYRSLTVQPCRHQKSSQSGHASDLKVGVQDTRTGHEVQSTVPITAYFARDQKIHYSNLNVVESRH